MIFRRGRQPQIIGLASLTLAACAFGACAHEEEAWQAKFQSTYIWQNKGAFRAAYSGPNSLSPDAAQSYSWTVTAFLGSRPWAGGELYFNPEGIQGRARDHVGLAFAAKGLSNHHRDYLVRAAAWASSSATGGSTIAASASSRPTTASLPRAAPPSRSTGSAS